MSKHEGKIGALDIYSDEDVAPGTIVIYNYGRLFINPHDFSKSNFNDGVIFEIKYGGEASSD